MLSAQYLGWIWHGYQVTVCLSLLSCCAATLLGSCLCIMRISQALPIRCFAVSYIAVFRNTPLLVQLFFWYFAVSGFLPAAIKDWLLTPHAWLAGPVTLTWPTYEFIFGFTGLTFYTAAFVAEELRAGIQTVPDHQQETASALGFKPRQALRIIILPQAVRHALSPLCGQYMTALKNSSLTAAIGVGELFYSASQIETRSLMAFEIYCIVTLLYIATIALMEITTQILHAYRLRQTGQRVRH